MTKLYVGNLPFSASEQDVRNFFQGYTLARVKIILDRDTQRPKGFGFVEIESKGDALEAISVLNGTELGGRRILVDEAVEKTERPIEKSRRPERERPERERSERDRSNESRRGRGR